MISVAVIRLIITFITNVDLFQDLIVPDVIVKLIGICSLNLLMVLILVGIRM